MMLREISLFDIHHNPTKVNVIMTDNAHALCNQLYILVEGNHVTFDEVTIKALQSLERYLKKVLDKQTQV